MTHMINRKRNTYRLQILFTHDTWRSPVINSTALYVLGAVASCHLLHYRATHQNHPVGYILVDDARATIRRVGLIPPKPYPQRLARCPMPPSAPARRLSITSLCYQKKGGMNPLRP